MIDGTVQEDNTIQPSSTSAIWEESILCIATHGLFECTLHCCNGEFIPYHITLLPSFNSLILFESACHCHHSTH